MDKAGRGQDVFLVCQTEAEVPPLSNVFGWTRVASVVCIFPLVRCKTGFGFCRTPEKGTSLICRNGPKGAPHKSVMYYAGATGVVVLSSGNSHRADVQAQGGGAAPLEPRNRQFP